MVQALELPPGVLSERELLVYVTHGAVGAGGDGFASVAMEDCWPPEVAVCVESASELVIVDPLSFPYEALTRTAWNVPMTIVVPDHLAPETLVQLLGGPLLERLTFFDRLMTDDDVLWDHLRPRFGLVEEQRLRRHCRDLSEVVEDLVALRGLIEAADSTFERPVRQIDRWALRTVRNKRKHIVQRTALEEQARVARRALPAGLQMHVAHFGIGAGRFLEAYRGDHLIGLDSTPWLIDQSRFNTGDVRFLVVGPERRSTIGPARCDLTIATHMVAAELPEQRHALIREMWAITRAGGRIVILDDLFSGRGIDTRTLIGEIVDITGGATVLADVVSLRYDESGTIDDGLIALTAVRVPGRW